MSTSDSAQRNARYWDELANDYQRETRISTTDFHYGPLLPGDRELGLLPPLSAGMRSLELGCGAGQNSMVLAQAGVDAIAIDVSPAQIAHGKKLQLQLGTCLDLRTGAMDELSDDLGQFDLIHSSYGLPFADDPGAVIRRCAELLRPGGTLLFSVGHPVYAGEWLELDENEQGIFLGNYFQPMPDVRAGDNEEESTTWAKAYPVSTTLDWVVDAGLLIQRVLEPAALPVHTFSAEEREKRVPYDSEGWAQQVHELQKFPIVLIVKAQKPT